VARAALKPATRHRPSCDPAHTARAQQLCEDNEQMDRRQEQIAHELEIIMPTNLRTCTAIHAKIYQFTPFGPAQTVLPALYERAFVSAFSSS
jgi:hypothetical protein